MFFPIHVYGLIDWFTMKTTAVYKFCDDSDRGGRLKVFVSMCLSSQPDQGHTTNSQFSVSFVHKEKSSPVQFADHFWITCGLYIVGK